MTKLDLHVHTEFSDDAILTLDEIEEAFDDGKIDQVAITDHDKIMMAKKAYKRFGKERIIVGQEVTTDRGAHIIGLFLKDFVTVGVSAKRVCQLIRNQGGIVMIPHPFAPGYGIGEEVLNELHESSLIDLIEGFNAWLKFTIFTPRSRSSQNERALNFVKENNYVYVANTDSHSMSSLGNTYNRIEKFATKNNLLKQLKSKKSERVENYNSQHLSDFGIVRKTFKKKILRR